MACGQKATLLLPYVQAKCPGTAKSSSSLSDERISGLVRQITKLKQKAKKVWG